jgi:hypothetical protein
MPEFFSLHESMILMHIIKFLQRHRRFQRKFHTGVVWIQHRIHVHHCKNYQLQASISSSVLKKFESGITRILSKTLTFKWLANEVHSTYRTVSCKRISYSPTMPLSATHKMGMQEIPDRCTLSVSTSQVAATVAIDSEHSLTFPWRWWSNELGILLVPIFVENWRSVARWKEREEGT